MKTRTFVTIFLLAIFLTSCTTGTAAPTLTAAPSVTPIPQLQLTEEAILYSGPGNDGYSRIGDLPAGTSVTLRGQFGDFVKVETTDAKAGFIVSSSLADLPQSAPQLVLTEVPWQDMDLRYNFIGDGGIVQKDQIKIVDINGNGTNVGNGSFTVDSAFRIRMSLRLEKNAGEYASVLLMGTPPVTEGDWWRGLIRLDIGANQQNKLQLCIRDGTSEQCNFESFVEIPTDQPFTILFDDPQGKVMHVLDQNGKEVQKVDIPQQTGLTLPDGLFPTHTVWPGAWVNPQVTLYIDSFIAENAPSGKAKLEDLPELAAWVDDYVHAYDGQVTVNDVKMDSQQLTAAIRQDNTTFLQTKQINGKPTSFLVVNGIPLAIQKSGELWRKVYGRDLADALKIDLAMPGMFSDISDATYREILENANKITITADLNTSVVYGKFSAKDWRSVLDNWDMIQAQINDGVIPAGYPYNWDQAQPVILFAQSHNMKVRVQHLLTGGDSIADSILHGNYSKDELKKILEFTTSITVLKYKGVVDEWDIEDEQVNVDINKYSSGDYGFWLREVGLVDATELVARTVKKLDPGSKLIATEAFLVEEKLGTQGAILRDHFLAFLDDLQSRGVPLDGVDIENGEWVYNPPAPEFEKQFLQKIQSRGLYLSAPETIVVLTPDKYPFWYEPVEKTAVVTNPLESQADVFRDITLTYLDLGAKGIGFGDVGDKWAFLNYSGETDANPSLFDDDSRPKQAYCAVMKVLYDYLP